MTPSPFESNRLKEASSPYLRQHADNPVHWQLWNEETLAHAKAVNKPILLSVGYAACHWCHVMAHESFEDVQTGNLMNKHFINIKVDREERPDVDQIYMAALHAMGEQGGWPLTMFLTPDTIPFWGGTYFPPKPNHGRPAFSQVLSTMSNAYQENSEAITKNTSILKTHLENLATINTTVKQADPSFYLGFQERSLKLYDPLHGGIKGAPKFPNAPILDNWVRASKANPDNPYTKAFIHTIERISNGGVYDHLFGGIARYSTDERWLAPHFEKMLYDNAHYLNHLTSAWKITGKELFRERIEQTINWLEAEMLLQFGAFASSIDADSEGVEGKFYIWDADELQTILTEKEYSLFSITYDVTSRGNWEGATILNRLQPNETSKKVEESEISRIRTKLLKIRDKRIRPGLDDKILTDWNGYLIRSIAEAGKVFSNKKWIKLATKAFHCITESNLVKGKLIHSWCEGINSGPANATDMASMINASLTLYQINQEQTYLEKAESWINQLQTDFSDGQGGYYLTSKAISDLPVRPRCDQDEANPSGSSQILEAFIRFANIANSSEVFKLAKELVLNQLAIAQSNPYGMAGFTAALHSFYEHIHIHINADEAAAGPFIKVINSIANPAITVTRNLVNNAQTDQFHELPEATKQVYAIVCAKQTCSAPLLTPDELQNYLKQ